MSGYSDGSPHYRSVLYTSQDYIKDLLLTNKDCEYYIKHLEDDNKQLKNKIEELSKKNKELAFYKNYHDGLEQKIIDLQKYINGLEIQLRVRSDATLEAIAFCATEADGKHEVKPSIVVMKDTVSDKLFSVNCKTSDKQMDDNFIDITEMKATNDLPKKFALMTIEWNILPITLIDVHNKRLLDVSEWRLKDNTIINVIPVEGHPFRPKANQILKIAFDGMIDFESLQKTAQNSLKTLTIDEKVETDEIEELVKYFDYMKSLNNNKNNLSPSSMSDQQTQSTQNNDIKDKSQTSPTSSSSISDEGMVHKKEEYFSSDDQQNKGSSISLYDFFESGTNEYPRIEDNHNNSRDQKSMDWRSVEGKDMFTAGKSINISDEEIYFDD